MKFAKIRSLDISNGPGCRVSIFFQGCSLHCKGCFNKEIWNFEGGYELNDEYKNLIFSYLKRDYINGISLLGGEPLDQSLQELEEFLKEIKINFPNKTIWLYTGYSYEDVKDYSLFRYVDVIVDGKFIESEKDPNLSFRGSKNQRIIHLHE